MSQTHTTRHAKRDDLPVIRQLLEDCQLPIEGVEDWLEEGYCVIIEEDRLVGIAGIEVYPPYGLLRSVAVSPEKQGYALGNRLVKDRLAWATARDLSSVYLITTDAEPYFQRFGFVPVLRGDVPVEIQASSEFSTICPGSATVMVKSLIEGNVTR